MKSLKNFQLLTILFLLFSLSISAEKTKKGKQKPVEKKNIETTKSDRKEKIEKENNLISVKTEPAELVEEKSTKKEREEVITKEEPKTPPAPIVKEEPVSITPPVTKTSTADSIHPITLNQYFSNDIWFRGFSVLGDRLAQRDNRRYQSMQHAWNLVTGVSYDVSENFSIGMNVYSPTAHRANRDNDFFMQAAPGDSKDFTQKYAEAAQAGNPNILIDEATQLNAEDPKNPKDPSAIKRRKEKNGLKDIFDASFTYKHNTRFGKIITGFYFANNDNFNITLGELVAGIEFPFWKALSPSFTSYYRFTSEGGGGGNGTSNHRIAISHKFFPENNINFTTSLSSGYQYHSNLKEYRSGVSDISPKIQVNYGSFYVSFMDMIRPDPSLWDAAGGFGSGAAYNDTNRRDGMVDDPSKIRGSQNQAYVDLINQGANSLHASNPGADPNGYGREAVKVYLTQNYQQQKFVTHIYFFTVGYSMKF